MSIPASKIVNITSRVINAGGNELEMAGLLLTKNPLCTFPDVQKFTSANAVGRYFGMESYEYKVAAKYFLGYSNSFKKPATIYFARAVTEPIAACLIGGSIQSLETLKKITKGSITISIDGTERAVSDLDLSSASTESEMAQAIEAKLTGTSVSFNSNLNAFIVTSKATGKQSKISFASGTDADALGLTESTGATLSEGSDALDPSALMKSVTNSTTNWATFTTIYKATADEIIGLAQWSNAQDVDYLFCPWTDDKADTLPTNKSNLPNKLRALDLEGVTLTYGDPFYAILPMAFAASIDWNRENGLPTFKFKSQSGLAANVMDETTADNLKELHMNFYGRYATRADDFTIFAEGAMTGGNYDYIDAYLGMVWLKNSLQLACMTGFTGVSAVPYTESGYALIRAWFTDVIEQAKLNGVIRAGVTLNELQKSQLLNEIGEDKSDTINTDGYYLLVTDPGAQARQNRESPTIGLWYTYGGAVHKLDVPVTMIK